MAGIKGEDDAMSGDMKPSRSDGGTNGGQSESKRRKSRKSVDKQYACDEPGCGKKFTRLEHLTRHQLNHKPKEIYRCTYPGCEKTFVRPDLRVRHLDRHRNRLNGGRRLRRLTNFRDSIDEYGHGVIGLGGEQAGAAGGDPMGGAGGGIASGNGAAAGVANGNGTGVVGEMALFFDGGNSQRDGSVSSMSGSSAAYGDMGHAPASIQNYSLGMASASHGANGAGGGRTSISGPTFKTPTYSGSAASPMSQLHATLLDPRSSAISASNGVHGPGHGGHGSPDPYIDMPVSDMRTPLTVASSTSASGMGGGPGSSSNPTTNPPSTRPMPDDALRKSVGSVHGTDGDGTAGPAGSGPGPHQGTGTNGSGGGTGGSGSGGGPEDDGVGANATNDFITWLLSDPSMSYQQVSDPFFNSSFYSFDSPISLHSLLSPPVPQEEVVMSESKRMALVAMIPGIETHEHSALPYLQSYIANYWRYFHPQYPILHKPSFQADVCASGLLWAIILVGAAFEKKHDLCTRIADKLRWSIFESPDFVPPAKLWVIQALLLLEIFEKSMTTRKLHERAHLHHGTLLQLVRRGSALTGDDTPGELDPWQRWIEAEATKRAALMAFSLDVFDAALFGHPLFMSVHEIRLSLPCSEALWDEYPSERGIPRTNTQPFLVELKKLLNKTHVDTGPFGRRILLSGLVCVSLQMQQRDLQVTSVGWGAFRNTWRDILSPAYDFWKKDHDESLRKLREERDQANGGGDKKDGKDARHRPNRHQSNGSATDGPHYQDSMSGTDDLSGYSYLLEVQGCTSPMYHLAHIQLMCSSLDFQVYAGCPLTFNHKIRKVDTDNAARRIKDMIATVGSKQALWHAIRFLREMFWARPEELRDRGGADFYSCSCTYPVSQSVAPSGNNTPDQRQGPDAIEPLTDLIQLTYDSSTDPISKRPHMLYLCALVVWGYNFFVDGPESKVLESVEFPEVKRARAENATPDELVAVMDRQIANVPSKESGYDYLRRMSFYRASELDSVTGRNHTVGLLRLVISALDNCTWEVAREGRRLLTHCIYRSLGAPPTPCDYMFNPRTRE